MHCDRLAATEREVVPKRPRVSEGLTGRNQVEVAPASLSQVVVLREIVRSKLHGVVRAAKQAIQALRWRHGDVPRRQPETEVVCRNRDRQAGPQEPGSRREQRGGGAW